MKDFRPVPVERAWAWIDAATNRLRPEEVALDDAAGRVLWAELRTTDPIPTADCAAVDGFALNSAATFGAGAYNPLTLVADRIEAGEPLPPGTDAVLAAELAECDDAGRLSVIDPLAVGANVQRRGAIAPEGAVLAAVGACLDPATLGLLGIAGVARVAVAARPAIRLVIAGRARSGPLLDSNGPMLRALIARDGGVVRMAGFGEALFPGADLVVIAGGTGPGPSDHSAAALAKAGSLEIYGVAMAPGDTAGFGRTAAGTPVILLPGEPAACLWAYEVFAGRAVRRLAGCTPELPYRRQTVITARKIVSAIGLTEIVPVRRLEDGRIEPVASFVEAGLGATIAADGFVIVAAASEGRPAGTAIDAYFYDHGGGFGWPR